MRTYVGVDYHRKYSYMTVMDERGKIFEQGQVANHPEVASKFLRQAGVDGDSAAVLEATRNWTVMHDWLEELVDEVHLVHPLKVKAIAEAKIKTDKIDTKVVKQILDEAVLDMATEGDIELIRTISRMSKISGYKPVEICWMTWLIQPEGNMIRMDFG